jgi:predicted dehydrogenase
MRKKVNWGLIGLGNASLNIANEINNVKNSNLFAIASHSSKKRILFQNKFKITEDKVYEDYLSLIKDPKVDLIYIGLPNSLHKKFIIKALKVKKNILVEKPMVTSLKEFQELKLHISKSTIFYEAIQFEFHPFYKKILNKIKKFRQQKNIKISISFGNDAVGGKKIFGFRLKKPNIQKRLFSSDLKGGAILDGGIYLVSFLVDIIYKIKNSSDFKIRLIFKNNKKLHNGVDVNSEIKLFIDDIYIHLKTSLEKKLENVLSIKSDNKSFIINDFINIDSKTKLMFGRNTIKNTKHKNSSYFYQIQSISNAIKNKKIYINEYKKLLKKKEMTYNILDQWLK